MNRCKEVFIWIYRLIFVDLEDAVGLLGPRKLFVGQVKLPASQMRVLLSFFQQ